MFYCYLLSSDKTPTCKATYVGFSVDPLNRLRQHNGEITSGARKTAKYRPWKHITIVGGFPNHQTALQFEWQWQHPAKSRIPDLDTTTVSRGVGYKRLLNILSCLLKTRLWKQLNLVVYFFSGEKCKEFTDMNGNAQVAVCATDQTQFEAQRKDRIKARADTKNTQICSVCHVSSLNDRKWVWSCSKCDNACHLVCLATAADVVKSTACTPDATALSAVTKPLLPQYSTCPGCNTRTSWANVVAASSKDTNGTHMEDSAEDEEGALFDRDLGDEDDKENESGSDSEGSFVNDESTQQSRVAAVYSEARADAEVVVLA